MKSEAQHWKTQEQKNKRKSAVITGILHLAVLIVFLLLGLTYPFPPPAEEGILINFGTADVGRGEVQPHTKEEAVEEVVPEEMPPVESAPEEVVEEELLTQDVEEAPMIAEKEEETKVEEKVEEPRKTEEPVKEEVEKEQPKEEVKKEEPKVNPDALFTGSKDETENESTGEGDNIYKGDKGVPDGDPDAPNYEGDKSTGLGDDGIGYALAGRRMVSRPSIMDKSQKKGRVVVTIKVDKNGKVIFAKFKLRGSTSQDPHLIKLAEEAAMKAKFNGDANAPEEQIGTITFNFKLK